jgi:hypothetical protein
MSSRSRPSRGRSRSPLVRRVISAALSVAFVGCGGSSSETPWPVEPDDVDLGPNADKPPDERSGAVVPASPPEPAADPEPPAGESP